MGYLICQECGGYYKLENGESKEDFVSCQCYGSLIYVEDIDKYLNGNNGSNKGYESNNDCESNKDFPEMVENKLSNVKSINEAQLDNFLDDPDYNLESGFRGELPRKKEISKSLSFSSSSKDNPKTRSDSMTNNVSNFDVSRKDVSRKDISRKDILRKDIPKTVVYNKSTSKRDPANHVNETKDVDGDGIFFIKFLGIKNSDKPLIGFIFLFVVFLGIGVILTMGYN